MHKIRRWGRRRIWRKNGIGEEEKDDEEEVIAKEEEEEEEEENRHRITL